jgi:hypothetical protein
MLAVIDAGFQPRGVVVGAIAMQIYFPICYQARLRGPTEPLVYPKYEHALQDAWRNAIERLEADAVERGAHGVVGVSVKSRLAGDMTPSGVRNFQLMGTAVVVEGAAPLARPFLSMLSAEDTLKLLLCGWVPSGVAVGISAVHVHGWAASAWRQGTVMKNAEMDGPTAGMALARDRAEHGARTALVAARAEGMVAAKLEVTHSQQGCGGGQGLMIEGSMIGTGIVRYRDPVATLSAIRTLSPESTR